MLRGVAHDMARDPLVWFIAAIPQAWFLIVLGARVSDALGIWP